MATGKDGAIGRQLRVAFNLGAVRDLSDGQLLERFATGRGEGAELAFAALVERHGPMVLRVARALLADPHDADDAFQATFLVLVAKARGLWARDSLGPWLHQVAHRTASCLRANAARRRRLDRRAAAAVVAAVAPLDGDADLARVLHEEIDRLPARYRAAVVLCDLEGRTHEQAARALGWPIGTVKSRQARARDRLRDRLTRRGVAPGLGLPIIRAMPGSLPAPVLIQSTTAAAVRFVASRAIVPGTAAALAREVISAMSLFRWGTVLPFVVALGVASGAALIAQDRAGDGPRPVGDAQAPPAADPVTVEVKPGKLNLTLTEPGSVEPSQSRAVFCEVEGTTTILRILPEGSQVKKGAVVAELESATLRDQLTNQRITEQQAEAAYRQAQLIREDAEQAAQEFAEGIRPQEQAKLRGRVTHARSGIEKGQARLERTKAARGRFDSASSRRAGAETPADVVADITLADRLDAAELDIQAATLDLEAAQGDLKLFQTSTIPRTTKRRQIDIEQARANEFAKVSAWELEKTRGKKLERQIAKCVLRAPGDGEVVYANDPNRFGGRQQLQIEEGAAVRERQIIFRVVDLTEPMRINAKVREARVDQIKPGQAVRIQVKALPDAVTTGVIQSVAPMADTLTFFEDNKKVYTTLVRIDGGGHNLRPGMKAEVEIPIFELDEVLSVPVGSVFQVGGQDRVLVLPPAGVIDVRDVTLGRTNEQAVEVKQGLQPGDRVIVAPASVVSEFQRAATPKAAPQELAPATARPKAAGKRRNNDPGS